MKSLAILLVGMLLNSSAKVWALGFEDFGNEPLSELNYRDWPGVMPLLKLPSWVYHAWCNGSEHFYYRGDTAALNDTLRKFVSVN